MIAIDSSSWFAFFSEGEPTGDDTALVESALADHQACLPPAVLTELLSDPKRLETSAHCSRSSPCSTRIRRSGSEPEG